MAIDYAALLVKIQALIADNGRDVSLVQKGKGDAVTGEPWGPPDPDATPIVVKAIDAGDFARPRTGTATKRRTHALLIAAQASITADLDDTWLVVDGGRTYEVARAEQTIPGGTSLLWQLDVVV